MPRPAPRPRAKTKKATAARKRSAGLRSATPVFFAEPTAFRAWLAEHGRTTDELTVGFYKIGSGKPSITWPEAVEEALAFGWIDGVRRSFGEHAYTNRFTPRRPGSNWSAVNIAKAQALIAAGRMTPAGLAAFERRPEARTRVYSYEQRYKARLRPPELASFKKHKAAWRFFQAQPPGYRALMAFFVVSARQDTTRARRLARLISESAAGRRLL